MKNIWKALLAIILSAVIYKLLGQFIGGKILTFVYLLSLLVIGYFMSPQIKRNNRWLGKVIISLLVIFIFALRLNIFYVKEFNDLLKLVGLHAEYLDILILFSGWAFHQV